MRYRLIIKCGMGRSESNNFWFSMSMKQNQLLLKDRFIEVIISGELDSI